ncbi:translation initiation factor IF-2 [Carboxydothermus pertinax]|uniref:Translation initiation factor IF-2 n=1 Tax=Carboxydothermus pertinax TaxID=870242 RepID=A0A1L8CX76_9THEO|nr:translation initiation factor IF-2 [Carboxydothermus pertinax]GAV23491.1 translation initiation factor IF-2 [Carboxydothermus pertinax]
MRKKRVFEIAKELNMESKEVISRLRAIGVEVKSHMSTVENHHLNLLLKALNREKEEKEKKEQDKKQVEQKAEAQKPHNHPQRPKEQQQQQKQGGPNRPREQRHERPQGQGQRYGGSQRTEQRDKDKNRRGSDQRPYNQNRPPRSEGQRDERRRFDKDRPAGQNPPQGQKTFGERKDRPFQKDKKKGVLPAIPKPEAPKGENKEPERRKGAPDKKREWEKTLKKEEKAFAVEEKKLSMKKEKKEKQETVVDVPKTIVIPESMTVQEFAKIMGKTAAEVIKKLMNYGILATINQEIDADTATIIATDFGFEVTVEKEEKEDIWLTEETPDDPETLEPRPPIVTVMGHVDHGKTSLLDAIRQTNVTATEAGGITQHIGAYQVEHHGRKITFIDTPGHEAFTAMRARGAQVTDIAILVVAADDGVMPQTIEAINHAKAAGVPIIVAVNKIDKPNAQPDRVKQQLTEYGLIPEAWGGDTVFVEVSALKKIGIEELLEMILLVSDLKELKANPNKPARGTVIEAQLDKGRGPVATVLVQSGTLNVGDAVVVGLTYGRVRALVDDKGRRVKKATPSMPVEVLGLNDVPSAGDILVVVEDEKTARTLAEKRQNQKREEELRASNKVSLEDLFKHIQEGKIKELNIVLKADVHGSVEAIRQSLTRLSTEEVKVNVIHSGVGAITETDIMLASASNAIVIGFNVRPDSNARKLAEVEKIDVRVYRIIYELLDDIKAAMAGLLEPEHKEVVLGRAEVRKTFKASKIGTIAGLYVLEGKIVRSAKARVIRDGVVVFEGNIDSLKRFKDDVREVAQGYECGLTIEKFNDIHEGDIIEAFTIEEVQRTLE